MIMNGSKLLSAWSPSRYPLMDANRWRRPRSGMIVMLVVLLVTSVAGLYASAVLSSSGSSSGHREGRSSSRRMSGLDKASLNKFVETHADGIEFKGLLSSAWWGHSDSPVQDDKPAPQTLVLYIFSNTDPEYIDNLRFYARTAIQEGDGCHHVIVVNSGPDSPDVELPELPSNAKYLHHPNECYDWGTFGWALKKENVQVSDYKYFIFLNSSVRGPFLPPYLLGKMHFSELMTGMINLDDAPNSIKLVGPSINCEGTVRLPGGLQRSNPHVQSFALATDRTGMKLLIDDGNVFGCYSNIDETIYHSELGSSDAILRAGYNLGSFMSRYQGVNWLDESLWNCNDGQNPFNWGAADYYSLQPMELMFVKVKHWPLTSGYPSMRQAVQYDAWSAAAAKGEQDVTGHLMKGNEWEHKAERVLKHAARGPECWDCEFYHSSNPDLAELPCHDAFAHFVNYGQFEPSRPFRWTCDTDWAQHGVPFQPDSLGGTRGWPLITTTSCEPVNSDPPPQALPEALGFEASGQQAVMAADVDDDSDELDTGDQQNDGDADEVEDGDNEEDVNGDDEEDAGGDSDAEDDGGFASASGALALMRSMIVNRIKQNRG